MLSASNIPSGHAQAPQSFSLEGPNVEVSPHSAAYTDSVVQARLEERLKEERNNAPLVEPLWDIKDVAAYLNVSKRLCETLVAEGCLPPIWIGGVRRFDPDAVKAYVRASAHGKKKRHPARSRRSTHKREQATA